MRTELLVQFSNVVFVPVRNVTFYRCRPQVAMSGFSQVEMSGSRIVYAMNFAYFDGARKIDVANS